MPLLSLGGTLGFSMRVHANPAVEQQVQTLTRVVSPTYFQTLRLRVVEGPPLSNADTLNSRPAVVVNRSFAQRYLGESAIGARLPLRFGEGRPDCDVVGVVEDMRQSNVTEPPAPEVFISYRQAPGRLVNGPLIVITRTAVDPSTQMTTLRTAIRELDPGAGLDSIMTMEERVLTNLPKPRLYAFLLMAFAVPALLIAGIGLVGVLSYVVQRRTREIGIRTALGAAPGDIARLVLWQGSAIVAAGLFAGIITSFLAAESVSKLLYGVSGRDVVTFVTAPVVIVVTAAIACAVPAVRAARIDPLSALRS